MSFTPREPCTQQPYTYSPLAVDSIRLLEISKDSECASFGSLKTVRLQDAPSYFALSYTWETREDVVPALIDGQVLNVSASLALAIQRVRVLGAEDALSHLRVSWLWIDRICINQDDTLERSEQVQIMGLIFSKAVRTLVWLGPDYTSCSAAWLLIDQIYNIFERHNPCARFLADIPFRIYSERSHADFGLPGWNDVLWQQLRELFQHPWFTRTWIIQEVALSREDPVILHGQYQYPWYRLGWASAWLRRNGYLRLRQVPNEIQNMDTISCIQRSRTRWNLDALLVATSIKCHATDQRDKVYALLGLAAEGQDPVRMSEALRPNYGLDIPEVYTKLARFCITRYKTLSTLTRASGLGSEKQSRRRYNLELLPSWVPNWCDFAVPGREVERSLSWLADSDTTGAETLGFPDHYHAAAGRPVKLFECQDQSILRISGLHADTVVTAIRFRDELNSAGRVFEPPMLRFWKAALPLLTGKRTIDWIASFIKATTAEQYRLSGNTWNQILKDGSAYILRLLLLHNECRPHSPSISSMNGEDIIELLGILSVGGDPEMYASLAVNFCLNRAFIITSKGYMGIGPVETGLGDCVAVLFGGEVPYILRRRENSFLLVGESYIHGLVNGEAIKAWKDGKLIEEIFEIQ